MRMAVTNKWNVLHDTNGSAIPLCIVLISTAWVSIPGSDVELRRSAHGSLCANIAETSTPPAITDLSGGGEEMTSW